MDGNRRHQVFLSSTYEDLKEERQAVILSLLELNCIPVGMEIFPAGDHDPWELIKRVIAESDYYVLILAGRYGSSPGTGRISYTEREYRYAGLEAKIPMAVFLRDGLDALPAKLVEIDPDKKQRLDAFRSSVQKKRLVRKWTSLDNLTSHVSSTIHNLLRSSPQPGWIRADASPVQASLQDQISQIKRELSRRRKDRDRDLPVRFDNHLASQNEMLSTAKAFAQSNDRVSIRVLGVSLRYSWPFLENVIESIVAEYETRVKVEVALVDPMHLDGFGLSTWSDKARGTLAAIEQYVATSAAVAAEAASVTVVQYQNLPHWHGVLINDSVLFMGRSNWEFESHDHPPRLFVGDTSYRVYYVDDVVGGADRIMMFNNWFNFYKYRWKDSIREFGVRKAE